MNSVVGFIALSCFVLLCFINKALAIRCDYVDGYRGCACRMSDTNEIMGLDLLIRNDTQKRVPRFTAKDNVRWLFAFHPCDSFNMFLNLKPPNEACVKSSAARYTDQSVDICQSFGDFESSQFYFDNAYGEHITSNLTLSYTNQGKSTKMVVSLVCNKSVEINDAAFKYINVTEGILETYYFSLTSKCCCPGICPVIEKTKEKIVYWYYIVICVGILLLIVISIVGYKVYSKHKGYDRL
ncbi:uncharacterized protein LOC101235613 isoform X2 [Hydra vulgaris]|uniref:Uncharacterized protein LOC101235613 isoform X2 n=1 Tax=Hydra vulgaris TaxID=6087 RepID=A0ABM4C438_HYDVU